MKARGPILAAFACAVAAGCAGILGIDDPPPVGGPAPSASPDASAADAGSDAPFCSRHAGAALCADFETDNYILGWTGQRGSVEHATDEVATGNGAARAWIDASSGCTYGDLYFVAPGAYHEAHLELSLKGSAPDGSLARAPLFTVGGGDGTTGCTFIFDFDSNKPHIQFQQGSLNVEYPYDLDPSTLTRFAHYQVDMDDKDGSTVISLTVDGLLVLHLDRTVSPALPACKLGNVQMSVGMFCTSATGDIRFDDVSLEVK